MEKNWQLKKVWWQSWESCLMWIRGKWMMDMWICRNTNQYNLLSEVNFTFLVFLQSLCCQLFFKTRHLITSFSFLKIFDIFPKIQVRIFDHSYVLLQAFIHNFHYTVWWLFARLSYPTAILFQTAHLESWC